MSYFCIILILSIWISDISYFIASSHLVRENLGMSDILMPLRQSETFDCVSLKETTPHLSKQQTKPQALGTWSRSHPLERGDFIMPFQIHLCLRALQTSTRQVLNRDTVIAVIFILCEQAINYLSFCGNILQNQRVLCNMYSSAPSTPCSEEYVRLCQVLHHKF